MAKLLILTLNLRVLGSSPSASTKISSYFPYLLTSSALPITGRETFGAHSGMQCNWTK
jgi:hypothetical protein